MDRNTFDSIAMELGSGRLDRRTLMRRLLGAGFGAAALGGGLGLFAAPAKHAAACQWPFDPPPGWPDYIPWPCGPGPTFPLKVPGSAEAAGVAFYVGSFDPGTGLGQVVGLDKKGNELRRFEFSQSGRGAVSFSMREGRTRLAGSTAFERVGDGGIRAYGDIDGQRLDATGFSDGSYKADAFAELGGAKARLFSEFQQLASELLEIGRGLSNGDSGAQASCTGCAVSGGGLSLGAGGCLLTGPGALACYGAWFVAAGVWVDECTGACAD